jgi:hypothetical protein
MPPVVAAEMPTSLLARFTGKPAPSLLRMLVFLSPLTGSMFTLTKGR